MKSIAKKLLSWGRIWLFFCNICISPSLSRYLVHANSRGTAIFVLTICVLASCRTALENNYSLINVDRAFLAAAFGDECVNASSHVISDVYKVGLSGLS